MLITSLIWDADGTLFDTYPPIYRSMELAMGSLGYTVQRHELIRLAQVDMATCFETLSQRHRINRSELERRYQTYRTRNSSDHQPVFDGLYDFCEWFISQGGRHYIVTHRDRSSLMRLVANNNCAHWFTDVVAGDDDYPRKPDPTGLLALVHRNNIDIHSALFIGDRELDILAAKNAGMLACLYGSALTNTVPNMRITQYAKLKERLQAYTVSNNREISVD